MKKSDLSVLIWRFHKNPSKFTSLFCEPKMEDLVAKINSSRKKKAQIHAAIHKPQQVLEKKRKTEPDLHKKQRSQIFLSPHLIHGRLQSTIDPHIKNRAVNRAWNLCMIHTTSSHADSLKQNKKINKQSANFIPRTI